MKFLTILVLCLSSVAGYAQEEELKQLLAERNLSAIGVIDLPTEESQLTYGDQSQDQPISGAFPRYFYTQEPHVVNRSSKKTIAETYAVSIVLIDGYTFHVADYSDGVRVVTCLDGNLKGDQKIGYNGVIFGHSTQVEWHKKYFVHRYPTGKVYSYVNKQIAEFK